MKTKRLVNLFAAIAFSMSTMAQFCYGPKLGLNLANQNGDDVDNNSMLFSFNAGVFGNYAIGDLFSLQGELMWDGKGAKYTFDDGMGNEKEIKETLGYLSIPVLLKASFGDEIKFFAEAGPQFGFLMSAKYDGESEFEYQTYDPNTMQLVTVTEKVKDWYKGMDTGLAVGAGTQLPAGNMGVIIDLRYNFSFGTIHEAGEGEEEADIKNSVISVNVALCFGGK